MTAPNSDGVDTLGEVLAMAETALKLAARVALRNPDATEAERQALAGRFRVTANAVAAMAACLPAEMLTWAPPGGGR